ncbi:MAG: Response regulator containing a CheY-like receiver domain and an HTH DNA-binding domain [Marinobacter excellens HL-55]|uniref:Response regulator containing a CheY-like receiver domain and an HTH DNA-binding domain n=1 Tax=Marinobacter excellens HL-55 TaxID=1305731 RepID=A0A0P7YAN2_9GAMM|nr:MAG: Response regulator containing a CheY-like receiver domain and an HTH DNA-binding domain [Marinobacter excellens HL-55]
MSELNLNASDLRAAYRATGLSERQLSCLGVCAEILQSPDDQNYMKILEAIADQFGAPHAALFAYRSGRLRILSSVGGATITASRQSIKANLAPFLKWPCKPYIRRSPKNVWLFYSINPGFEWIIPVALQGSVIGLLALAGFESQFPPGDREQQLIKVIASMLSGQILSIHTETNIKIKHKQTQLSLLSPREKEVMSLLPRGMSNARIAATLGISPGTVKTHVERILKKLQLEDRTHAAALAVELKLGNSGC